MRPLITLEVCIDSLASAKATAQAGAQRVELNTALELGGLTPSAGLTRQTLRAIQPLGCKVIAMVRPRPGHFVYSHDEILVMQDDIAQLLTLGVDGIALGVLTATNEIDEDVCDTLIMPILAAGKEAVFHRAIDLTPDPVAAVDRLDSLGFSRILTSGGAPTAAEGAPTIRRMIEQADNTIQILPASGITPDNVAALIEQTGCTQVHGSLRHIIDTQPATPIEFNSTPLTGGAYYQADTGQVAAMIDALRQA